VKRRLKALALTATVLVGGLLPLHASAAEKQNKKETLTVFAASSLNKTFLLLGKEFEKRHPGVNIRFSFLSSATLATQVNAGAPADLFASASQFDMVKAKTQVLTPKRFTANRIVLATPKANDFHIRKVAELNKRGVKWIQCTHSAPCGVAADSALSSEGSVKSKPVSLEQNVASVVSKLISGEVDAALIYHTDYLSHAAALREIAFKDSKAATTLYFVGVVKSSSKKTLSTSFIDLLLSVAGRKALASAGFLNVSTSAS
jgi:molybdate transport system substrate-binding protein